MSLHHYGDPCVHCGIAHDDVPPGPCAGDASKAVVQSYAVIETRWDGVERYRYRMSSGEVRETHAHVSSHLPYYHFGLSRDLITPPRYDLALKTAGGKA